jgi:hypothetical protein
LKAIAGIFAACLAMSTGVSPADSADPPVIVDLSKDFVAITAGFTGTEVQGQGQGCHRYRGARQ